MRHMTYQQARRLLASPQQARPAPPPGLASTDTVSGPCVTCGFGLEAAAILSLCGEGSMSNRGCGKPVTATAAYQHACQAEMLTPQEWRQALSDQLTGGA